MGLFTIYNHKTLLIRMFKMKILRVFTMKFTKIIKSKDEGYTVVNVMK